MKATQRSPNVIEIQKEKSFPVFCILVTTMGFFKVVVLLSLFPLVVSAVECEGTPGCYTLQMLELWKRFKIIDLRFNALELWQRMDVAYKRWSTPEIDLWNASDVFWQKYVEFGIAKGKPGDYWNGTGPFMEFDPTMLVKQTDLEKFPGIDPRAVDVVVLEPCNSVSNIALIRAMLGVSENDQKKKWSIDDPALRGLVQAFSYAGPASFLMHSSGTNVGGIVDNESIHHMALIAHQASLQSLPYDPVLHDLKETPASYSGQQSVAEAFRIFLEEPIADWDTLIKDLDTIT